MMKITLTRLAVWATICCCALVLSLLFSCYSTNSGGTVLKQSEQTSQESWKNVSPETMSAEDIFKYLHFTNHSACRVAYDFGGKVHTAGSVKGVDGQKTVCMDEGVAPVPGKCLIYSFGINDEWSFDKMFEEFGCQVYAFDPSMSMADGDYTPNIHFFRLGIADQDTDSGLNGWKMRSLDSIYEMLEPMHGSEAVIDYLKMDVEEGEWIALPQMLQSGMFDRIKQIAVEAHFDAKTSLADFRKGVRVLQALEHNGMVRFSSRVNIWMTKKVDVLDRKEYYGYEITWFNQKFKKQTENTN